MSLGPAPVPLAFQHRIGGLLQRLGDRFGSRQAMPFDVAWELVRLGQAAPLPRNVRAPAVVDSRLRLRAAYLALPVLAHLHRLVPDVLVEGSSVDVAEHLSGDYHPDQQLIRIECHHAIEVIAFTLLHEFGHAIDHELLDDRDRESLGHPTGAAGWRDRESRWERRGEEWFAESLAHWWWPARHEPHRPFWRLPTPPLDEGVAAHAFDLHVLAERVGRRRTV